MTSYITSQDGLRIAFDVEGSGPPLLFFHCLPGTRAYWAECGYVEALRDRYTVARMDTRGFGESDAPTDPAAYAEERVLADALAVMDAISPDSFILWGHSYGATIARQLGATSDRVARVIMAGGHFGRVFTEERANEQAKWFEALARAQTAADPIAALDALDVEPAEREEALSYPVRTTLLTMRSLVSWRPFAPADIQRPALVITGMEDTRVLEALDADREAISAAGVRIATLPHLNHEQLVTERDTVLPVALAFLDGH